ncbi:MAG: hypothetical protein DRP63_08305, partial [Planctomycetota bacterium]
AGRVGVGKAEPFEGRELHPPEGEKEVAKSGKGGRREVRRRKASPGCAKRRGVVGTAAVPKLASSPARPTAEKIKKSLTRREFAKWEDHKDKGVGGIKAEVLDNALEKSQRNLGKVGETKPTDKLLKEAEKLARRAYLEEMMERDEKMLRNRMRKADFGGVEVALFKAWVSEDAVEGLMHQINAVAEIDEFIMKTGVKRGEDWVEVKLTVDKRGARVIRALITTAPKGDTLFIVRFCYR